MLRKVLKIYECFFLVIWVDCWDGVGVFFRLIKFFLFLFDFYLLVFFGFVFVLFLKDFFKVLFFEGFFWKSYWFILSWFFGVYCLLDFNFDIWISFNCEFWMLILFLIFLGLLVLFVKLYIVCFFCWNIDMC